MKLHQNIVQLIHQTLDKIFNEHELSDKIVPKILQQKILGSRDRKLIASTIYDIVRWKRKYEFIYHQLNINVDKNDALIAISLIARNIVIDNLSILSIDNAIVENIEKNISTKILDESINNSYDENLYNYILESLGSEWHEVAQTLNTVAPVYLYINPKKITVPNFTKELDKLNIEYEIPNYPSFIQKENWNCIKINSQQNLKNTNFFKEYFFSFQDFGSQCIGILFYQYIDKKEKTKILDYCAGHGGKTFQITNMLKSSNTQLFATDFNPKRLHKLKQNIKNKSITILDFNDVSAQQYNMILIDAPCSGTGTFRRQPDLKYNLSIASIEDKIKIQHQVLVDAASYLLPNGIIVYATCSILPQENQLQIKVFLDAHKTFNLVEEHILLPSTYNTDGFYMCVLKKIV
ncbi:MAG: RsmB/NOP family class I SAM-dependent RNA methyltransferase [Sphingobacteriales bacterium]|nr:MAG: RsmB/NOP family class I SAM-dependent RNA methyltransferase [Sphingobacteriales bacterium]